ncbi:N-acetylmuramoyl-L-alanine amidase [Aurantivibrio plasticivorans]
MFLRYVQSLLIAALVVIGGEAYATQNVESVRLWRAPDNTRIVFDLSGPVEHKIFTLANPNRLVIDVNNAQFKASLNHLALSDTPVSGLRTGKRNSNDLRIVLDLKSKVDPSSFVLAKHGDKSDRLVLDLYDLTPSKPVEPTIVDRPSNVKRDIIIAIDAGHGGEDPGAIGAQKIKEKDVVLDISKRLAKQIDATPGYKAVLIRTGDYYIALRQRRELARKHRADLFVSIHADAFKHKSARGASVFTLSRRGAKATSEFAANLASQENKSDLIGGVVDLDLRGKDQVLVDVLVDLSMTHTLSSSLEVGDEVLKSMGGIAHLHKQRVEQANFAVLRSADMPSLLVETGFISNPGEAKRLSTPKYRQQIADKIFYGVNRYFQQVPPPDSYLAWLKSTGKQFNEHVIVRGDTLSAIAQRYKVSVNDILSVNGLNSTNIRVGQRLKIPTS